MLSPSWEPFRIGMLVAFVLATGFSCTPTDRDAAVPVRNVLFIMGDDHARHVLGAYGGLYDEDAQGTYFARKAVDFLKANRDERFCLWLSFREPHAPFHFPVDYSGRIDPDRMPLPKVSTEDEPGVPSFFATSATRTNAAHGRRLHFR